MCFDFQLKKKNKLIYECAFPGLYFDLMEARLYLYKLKSATLCTIVKAVRHFSGICLFFSSCLVLVHNPMQL